MLQLLGQDPERTRKTNECREKIRVLKDAISKKVATYNLEVLKQVLYLFLPYFSLSFFCSAVKWTTFFGFFALLAISLFTFRYFLRFCDYSRGTKITVCTFCLCLCSCFCIFFVCFYFFSSLSIDCQITLV